MSAPAPINGRPSSALPWRACWPLALLALSLTPARADWSRLTMQSVQQTTASSSESLTLQRSNLNAVAASGVHAGAPLIEQGQWNPAVPFTPSVAGGSFSLSLHGESAGVEASRSFSVAPNRLEGGPLPDGSLRGGPGAAASDVRLSIVQTYSVF
jgi:hypothetical protein